MKDKIERRDCCGFMFSHLEFLSAREGVGDFWHHKTCKWYPKSELQQKEELEKRKRELLGIQP